VPATPLPCCLGLGRCSTQAFPFRGRCPKGGWGPQQVQAGPIRRLRRHLALHDSIDVRLRPSPTGEGARRADGAPSKSRWGPIRRLRRHLPLKGKDRPCAPSDGCAATLLFREVQMFDSGLPLPGEGARRADGAPSKSVQGPIRRLRRHLPLKGKDGPCAPSEGCAATLLFRAT